MDSWLKMFSPVMDVRMPAAGDVQMDYSPWTNWGWYSPKAGDPQMEDAVYRNVARPGRQLGKIIKAVQALKAVVDQLPPDVRKLNAEQEEAITQLEDLANEIERKKEEVRIDAASAAKDALDHLSQKDARRFQSLIREMYEELNKEPT